MPSTDNYAPTVPIIVVDDHPWIRLGLVSLIEADPAFKVCGEAETATEALELALKCAPAVAVVDISLKGNTDGIELARMLRERHPELKVLILSMHSEPKYAARALAAGANGYMTKSEAPDRLMQTLHKLLAGETYLSDDMREPQDL